MFSACPSSARCGRERRSSSLSTPARSNLTRYAYLWLRPYPGTDPVLLGGLLRVIIDSGLADLRFHQRPLGRLGRVGLVAGAVHAGGGIVRDGRACRAYRADGAAIRDRRIGSSVVGWRQLNRRYAPDNLPDRRGCWVATGNVGKPGAGVMPIYHGANEQGAWIWAHGQRRFGSSPSSGSGGP